MTVANIREQLHHFIDTMEDKKAEAIYLLFENEIDPEAQRKKLILAERERYLRGEGRNYTVEEANEIIRNKARRNELL